MLTYCLEWDHEASLLENLSRFSYLLQDLGSFFQHEVIERSHKLAVDAWAVDFDCIYPFLSNAAETGRPVEPLIEILCRTEGVRFAFPPGTIHELVHHCYWLIRKYAFATTPRQLLAQLAAEAKKPPSIDLDLGESERALLVGASEHIRVQDQIARRLKFLLSNSNLVSLACCGVTSSMLDNAELLEHARQMLFVLRPGPTDLRNARDAMNLAVVACSKLHGLRIPLITNTNAVVSASQELQVNLPREKRTALWRSPREALLAIYFRKASNRELSALRDSARSLRAALDAYFEDRESKNAQRVFDLRRKQFSQLLETFDLQFNNVQSSSQPSHSGNSSDDLPATVPTMVIAERLSHVLQGIHKSVEDALSKLADLQAEATDLASVASRHLKSTSLDSYFQFLDSARRMPSLIIQNLVIVGELSNMATYNVRQSGTGHTAVIDSFKTITKSLQESGFLEAATLVAELADLIKTSRLPDEAKAHTLAALSEVSGEASKCGTLPGKVQILWRGLQGILETIPKAADAWKKLNDLWSTGA